MQSAPKTLQILTEAYRDDTLSCLYVFEWHKWFSGESDSVKDDEHAVRPRIGGRRLFASSYIGLVAGKRVLCIVKCCWGDPRRNSFKVAVGGEAADASTISNRNFKQSTLIFGGVLIGIASCLHRNQEFATAKTMKWTGSRNFDGKE
ncbi:hypothetical protein TNCV_2575441 [Trichonephila clavipes]|uniref:Uncharacterized protein n=1 Tax=Trichonephila clavipes TaxID=2585209 RepID=A0A8X6RAC1_TRICX|nr:hypothetical protein TNCV_2575441 [Trichonephila clavipes]